MCNDFVCLLSAWLEHRYPRQLTIARSRVPMWQEGPCASLYLQGTLAPHPDSRATGAGVNAPVGVNGRAEPLSMSPGPALVVYEGGINRVGTPCAIERSLRRHLQSGAAVVFLDWLRKPSRGVRGTAHPLSCVRMRMHGHFHICPSHPSLYRSCRVRSLSTRASRRTTSCHTSRSTRCCSARRSTAASCPTPIAQARMHIHMYVQTWTYMNMNINMRTWMFLRPFSWTRT